MSETSELNQKRRVALAFEWNKFDRRSESLKEWVGEVLIKRGGK